MKVSKSRLLTYLALGVIVTLNIFVLNPILKENYFRDDIFDFEENSWKYSIVICLVLFLIFTFFAFKKNQLNKKFLFHNLITVSLIAVFGKGLIDDALLYVNLKINVEKYTKSYVVKRYDLNKVFHIYDNKNEFIVFDEQLKKIDSLRMKRNLKSLYLLQNDDTLNVEYKKGLLNVKFLN
jgi:hypothetical protein